MLLIALAIGIVLIVTALRGTQGTLFAALLQDVPAYVVVAAAILAVGAIGYVPGLKPVSRGLLALVFVVLILRNYQAIISGFQAVAAGQATAPAGGGTGATSHNPISTAIQGFSAALPSGDESAAGMPNYVGAY